MSYRIQSIRLYVRETPPNRMAIALGSQTVPAKPETNPLAHVRLVLRDGAGRETFGCSGDRLSVRWLDKRPGRSPALKLRELVALIDHARDVYLQEPEFDDPFAKWLDGYKRIMQAGRNQGQEALSSSFASALIERAMLDAVCRLNGEPVFQMVRQERLGFQPSEAHPELDGVRFRDLLEQEPLTEFHIRHTIGLADPLTGEDLRPGERVNDGLPETLEEYIRSDGLTYFKIKISGDRARDLRRLARIWELLPMTPETHVTLDANEAYPDLEAFSDFVHALRKELKGLFDHILFIEQPMPRDLTLNPKTGPVIRRIAAIKPLEIDEADGGLDSFKRAFAIGYSGVSHKNCKGFFKSLLNRALVAHYNSMEKPAFQSAEDLQNLPIVPLQQDFTSLSILGIPHCERNGHHYNFGLSMLPESEKAAVAKHHQDLYIRRGDEWFLNIVDGMVRCGSLQCPGFGVREEPDWASMSDMHEWLESRDPK